MEHQALALSAEEILARRRLQNRVAQRKRRQRRAEMERQREKEREGGSRTGVAPAAHQDCIHCQAHQGENSQYSRTNSGYDHEEPRDAESDPHISEEPRPADTANAADLGEQDVSDEMLHSDFVIDRMLDLDAEHDIPDGPACISLLPSKPSTPLFPTPGSTSTVAESNSYRPHLSVALPTPTSPRQTRPQFERHQAATTAPNSIAMISPPSSAVHSHKHEFALRYHPRSISISHAAEVNTTPAAFPHTPSLPSSPPQQRRTSFPVHHHQQGHHHHSSMMTMNVHEGKTALHLSAERGSLATVQFLLAHHADVDSVDSLGRTALHLAAARGHVAVVDALLRAGADTEVVDLRGLSPIHVAVEQLHAAQAQAGGGGGGDSGGGGNDDGVVAVAVLGLLVRDGADLNAPIRASGSGARLGGGDGGGEMVVGVP